MQFSGLRPLISRGAEPGKSAAPALVLGTEWLLLKLGVDPFGLKIGGGILGTSNLGGGGDFGDLKLGAGGDFGDFKIGDDPESTTSTACCFWLAFKASDAPPERHHSYVKALVARNGEGFLWDACKKLPYRVPLASHVTCRIRCCLNQHSRIRKQVGQGLEWHDCLLLQHAKTRQKCR